jgi:hypothetical protein
MTYLAEKSTLILVEVVSTKQNKKINKNSSKMKNQESNKQVWRSKKYN